MHTSLSESTARRKRTATVATALLNRRSCQITGVLSVQAIADFLHGWNATVDTFFWFGWVVADDWWPVLICCERKI
jgi:hypothetical protein